MERNVTKFFYNLERVDGFEYVVIKVEQGGFTGFGAILPVRRNGENYKIFMGVIEEYRSLVEKTPPEEVFQLPYKLNAHFPGHPKVTFAIQAAMLSLFCKKHGIDVSKVVGGGELPKNEVQGQRLMPEYTGDVMSVRYIRYLSSNGDQLTYVFTKYPRNEMDEILSALSTNFKYLEVLSWRELL